MKKYAKMIFTFFLLLLLPLLLWEGTRAAEGVRQGLELCYRAVLPALFPAMVVCGMIGELAEYIPLPPNRTLWLTSHLCGFPLGIRMVARAYHRRLIDRSQAQRLSACCANASPAFLIVYGGNLLGSRRDGILLFLGQLLVSLIIALANGALQKSAAPPPKDRSLLSVAAASLSSAATGGLILTGYITFFSMLAALCRDLPGFGYLYGFLELTGGLAALPAGGPRLLIAGAMAGFSGFSVLLQNASYLLEEGLSLRPLLRGKLIYAAGVPLAAVILREIAELL